MKSVLLSIIATSLLSLSTLAQPTSSQVSPACLAKVVSAVNKHHTLGEGRSYALRLLYAGTFGAAMLVGHSDETEPTDYLVSVDLYKDCTVKAIVYSEDSSQVAKYTQAEMDVVSAMYEAQAKELQNKAVELIQKIPGSDYDVRILCITGSKVTAQVPLTHWTKDDRKTATGTLSSFPEKYQSKAAPIELTGPNSVLVSGSEGNGFYKIRGSVNGKPADICLIESRPILEIAY